MSNKTDKPKKENQKGIVKFWVRDDGIVEFKVVGVVNEQTAQEILKKMDEEKEMIRKISGKAKLFTDLSKFMVKVETGWSSSAKVRKAGVDFLKWDKIEKIAILGRPSNILLKVGVSTLLRMLGMKKAKYFTDRKEATEWLKNK